MRVNDILMTDINLLQKYNVPVPRYTSYPTVPYWKEGIDRNAWQELFKARFVAENKRRGISLYLHLPFCESLCTYCGCNKKITTNHSVEEVYMEAILKEWQLYLSMVSEKPVLRELHLGGGTPTFFSPENLDKLITTLLSGCDVVEDHEFSIEGHPNNTTLEHLQTLYKLGFRRISYGVQDNDPEVQRIINRIQPFSNVQNATNMAREVGFASVNFDLIYGLPLQNEEKMRRTIEQCVSLRPDRIAFYSYAHVPWTSRGQRLFDEHDLPGAALKMQLYLLGRQMFTAAGYSDIGMDHFALPNDELFIASQQGRLHRSFMGYTTQNTAMLIGLGVSAISDLGNGFAQNDKTLANYYKSIENGMLPVQKGYFLSEEDVDFRSYILDISCKGKVSFNARHRSVLEALVFPQLEEYRADGLVEFDESGAHITEKGKYFIRNICSAFDLHMLRSKDLHTKQLFSKAV